MKKVEKTKTNLQIAAAFVLDAVGVGVIAALANKAGYSPIVSFGWGMGIGMVFAASSLISDGKLEE